ncbi:MAG: CapA family protein [Cyclobacteriaceae bacterium]|nr:CapA family protein [Cyclobacteriaceae bacterium]
MRKILVIIFSTIISPLRAQDTTAVSLLFVGDIMQHESQMKSAYDPVAGTYTYSETFAVIKEILSTPDLTIGNLELTLGGKPYTGYPQFSAPDELLPALRDAGFDVLVTANNHSMDRGRKGLERTIRLLDSIGMKHTGTFADTVEYLNDYPLMLEAHGIKIALLNYTYGTNGIAVRSPSIVNLIDTARITKDLHRAAQAGSDLSIVFFHWGDEYQQLPNEAQKRVAAFTLAHGAKMVIGSHPHVIQPMIWNQEAGQLVVYSLGNFISGQRPRYRNGGAMVHVDIEKVAAKLGAAETRVVNVDYSLSWVYRASDTRRTFQLIPVTDGVDSAKVHGSVSRTLMKEFIDDSRAFLQRENINVKERAKKK